MRRRLSLRVSGKRFDSQEVERAHLLFGTDVSGQFFASAQGKFSGPIEVQRQPHLYDRASQEAAWQAVVKVSGVDFSSAPEHAHNQSNLTKSLKIS
jgi:hypothetical protein